MGKLKELREQVEQDILLHRDAADRYHSELSVYNFNRGAMEQSIRILSYINGTDFQTEWETYTS